MLEHTHQMQASNTLVYALACLASALLPNKRETLDGIFQENDSPWLASSGGPAMAVRVELLSIPLHSSSRVVLQRYVESAGKKGSSVD